MIYQLLYTKDGDIYDEDLINNEIELMGKERFRKAMEE